MAAQLFPSFVLCEADQFFTAADGGYHFEASKLARAHGWCQEKAKLNLEAGRDVVVANTFTCLWEMRPYLDMARRLGVAHYVIEANGDYGSVHGVPAEVIERMRNRWERYCANSSTTQAAIEVCAVNEEHSRLPLGFPAPEPAFRSRFAARFRSPVVVHVAVAVWSRRDKTDVPVAARPAAADAYQDRVRPGGSRASDAAGAESLERAVAHVRGRG